MITGAVSGIGHAFALHYASSEPESMIIALDIAKEPPSDLQPSSDGGHRNLHYYPCDVTNPSAIVHVLAAQLGDLTDSTSCKPIHMLIHSAGIRGLVPEIEGQTPHNVAAAETWQVMNKDTLMRTFEINAVGTFLVIRACLPYLLRGSSSDVSSVGAQMGNRDNSRTYKAKAVVMGSRMGSMSYNTTGGGYAYRASKAGLNAMMKSFSIDVPEVVFTVIHPGRVETRLVKVKEEGAISAEESLRDMVPLIEGLDSRDTGRYMDRFGKDIGW